MKLRCLLGHQWESDVPISLRGMAAIAAGLWEPPRTCKRCKKHIDGVNVESARKNGCIEKEST